MKRKAKNILLIIYNFMRIPIVFLLSLGKIKFSWFEMISPRVDIEVYGKGKIEFGKLCGIDKGTLIRASGGKILVHSKVYINRNCNIVSKEKIVIKERVCLGPNICIYDHDHAFGENRNGDYKTSPIIIEKNVWIGANVIVLKGVRIGENSVIGAGSIISKNIPKNTLVTSKKEFILKGID